MGEHRSRMAVRLGVQAGPGQVMLLAIPPGPVAFMKKKKIKKNRYYYFKGGPHTFFNSR